MESMLKIRLIPVLLLKNGRMVKPKQFGASGERDVGFPTTTANIYNSQDADELIFLDINATNESRSFLTNTLIEVAKKCFIPLTVGGGIKTLQDIDILLKNGADKISINSAAIENPNLILECSKKFGSQCIVISIDVKKNQSNQYEVFSHRGTIPTGLDPVAWAKKCVENGAGEILLTNIDREGLMQGYDLDLIKEVSDAVSVPVIANGGAGTREHFVEGIKQGHASAVAASSIFHFTDSNLTQVKSFISNSGISMRS